MYYNLEWDIKIGQYQLGLLDGVEIHKSVDLLADTCVIKLPGSTHGKALNVEGKIKPGDKVAVWLGYSKGTEAADLKMEFEGYLQRIDTDDGSLTLNCEDDLYLLRKPVRDKEFKNAGLQQIAQYLLDETKTGLKLNCTLTIQYDKFVISRATAFDVLKKLQEEAKGNYYIRGGVLHIHPLYTERHGYVTHSFQRNIESADLKYRMKEERKVEVIVERTMPDGKRVRVTGGTTGGDRVTLEGSGLSMKGMQEKADAEAKLRSYDGYEGSITTWLIPYVEPGYSDKIIDEDYEFKNGSYYVTAVTTSMDSSGGKRKIQLGIRLN